MKLYEKEPNDNIRKLQIADNKDSKSEFIDPLTRSVILLWESNKSFGFLKKKTNLLHVDS